MTTVGFGHRGRCGSDKRSPPRDVARKPCSNATGMNAHSVQLPLSDRRSRAERNWRNVSRETLCGYAAHESDPTRSTRDPMPDQRHQALQPRPARQCPSPPLSGTSRMLHRETREHDMSSSSASANRIMTRSTGERRSAPLPRTPQGARVPAAGDPPAGQYRRELDVNTARNSRQALACLHAWNQRPRVARNTRVGSSKTPSPTISTATSCSPYCLICLAAASTSRPTFAPLRNTRRPPGRTRGAV